VYLALLTKLLRVRSEKEKKAKPSKQEHQWNTNDPLASPSSLELIQGLWVDRSLWLCLGVESIALVLNAKFWMLVWLEWWWLGVFIALNHQTTIGGGCYRWAHRTLSGAPSDAVRCASHVTQPLGFWSSWPLEACLQVAPDRHYSVSGAPLTSGSDSMRIVLHYSSKSSAFAVDRCANSRCSAVTPNSMVAHQTVQWIIAERALRNPRVASLRMYGPGAPDSSVHQTRAQSSFLLLWIWTIYSIFYWFVLNLYAPVEHVF
jgi:hypothetical protein